MAREFAGEDSSIIAHLLLDIGVADAAFVRDAARLLDHFLYGAGRAEIIEDGRSGIFLEDALREKSGHEIHRDDDAHFIDESDAIRITVIADAEIRM